MIHSVDENKMDNIKNFYTQKVKENKLSGLPNSLFLNEVIKGEFELDNECDECKEGMRSLLVTFLDLNEGYSTTNVNKSAQNLPGIKSYLKTSFIGLTTTPVIQNYTSFWEVLNSFRCQVS